MMTIQGLRPKREYQFHPQRRWRFDFAWPSLKVAAEVEGGIYVRGRHVTPKGFIADCEKYNAAAERGWRVLRYPVVGKHWAQDAAKQLKQIIEDAKHDQSKVRGKRRAR